MSAVVPFLAGVVALVAQGADGPVLYSDELAYLGMAVDLSARDATVQLSELEFYSPGYALLLSPLVTLLPFSPWVLAVALNLVCLALLGPLLRALLLEVLDVDRRTATIAATLAACSPSLVLQVPRAWPEVLLATLVAAWALLLARFADGRHRRDGVLTVLLALVAFTVHRRSIVLVAVSVAVVLLVHLGTAGLARRDPDRVRHQLTGAGVAVALATGWLLLNRALDARVRTRLHPGADLVNANERALELAGEDVLTRVVSQGWATVHATFGLVLLGLVAAVVHRRRDAPLVWPLVLLVTTGGTLLVSAVAVADGTRVDHALYERYLAPVAVIAVAIGLAALLDPRRRFPPLALLALPATTALALLVVPGDAFEGNVQKLTVPTLSSLEHLRSLSSSRFLQEVAPVPIAAVVLVVAAAAVALRRVGPTAVAALWSAVFAVVVVGGSVLGLRPFLDHWEPYGRALAGAAAQDGAARIGVAGEVPEPLRAVIQYRLGHVPVVDVDGTDCPALDHVIAAPGVEPAWPHERIAESTDPPAVLLRATC